MFSSCCGCGNKKASLKVANDDDPKENNCDNDNSDTEKVAANVKTCDEHKDAGEKVNANDNLDVVSGDAVNAGDEVVDVLQPQDSNKSDNEQNHSGMMSLN